MYINKYIHIVDINRLNTEILQSNRLSVWTAIIHKIDLKNKHMVEQMTNGHLVK